MSKITALTAISTVQTDDLLAVVDVHDTTMAASGTTKKMTLSQLAPGTAAYQFTPEAQGAKGNGIVVNDAAITTATANLACTTSTPFTSTAVDGGKSILISGAGTSGADLVTTISTVTDSGHAVLAANAGTTVTANGAVFGTDDTTAIQNAVNAAVTYGEAAYNRYCEVVFGAKIYILAGALQVGGSGKGNAQVILPYLDSAAAGRALTIAFTGAQDPGTMGFNSQGSSGSHEGTPAFFGTVLCSLRLDGTNDATNGPATIIGGPYAVTGGRTADFTNLQVIVNGINCVVPHEPTIGGFDLATCANATVNRGSCHSMDINPASGAWPQFHAGGPTTNTFPFGLRMPCNQNNNFSHVGLWSAEGMGNGIYLSDATSFEELRFQHCATPVLMGTLGSDMTHGIVGRYIYCRNNSNAIVTEGGSHACRAVIQCMELDNSGNAITDSGDTLNGHIGIRYPSEPAYNSFTVTGSTECTIHDLRQFVGPVSSPQAAPSTGSAWQNQYWRDAWITLSATTITAVTISNASRSNTQAGLAGSPATFGFVLPAGQKYTPTYTGTLTHTVTLL